MCGHLAGSCQVKALLKQTAIKEVATQTAIAEAVAGAAGLGSLPVFVEGRDTCFWRQVSCERERDGFD